GLLRILGSGRRGGECQQRIDHQDDQAEGCGFHGGYLVRPERIARRFNVPHIVTQDGLPSPSVIFRRAWKPIQFKSRRTQFAQTRAIIIVTGNQRLMPVTAQWHRLGPVSELQKSPLQQIEIDAKRIALSFADGQFGAISGDCLHYGGPLGNGTIHDGYVVCPWHHWMFHRLPGEAQPGIPAAVPRYELKLENGDLYINLVPVTSAK